MNICAACITLELARGEIVSLVDARGVRIGARDGGLWITQERSRADHFVAPGAQFTVTRPGRTVIEALDGGRVQLSRDAEEAPLTRLPALGTITALAHPLPDRSRFQPSGELRQGGTR